MCDEDNDLAKQSALVYKGLSVLQCFFFLIYITLGGSQAIYYYNSYFRDDKVTSKITQL